MCCVPTLVPHSPHSSPSGRRPEVCWSTLAGDVFLSSACIAYLGAFTAPFRLDMIKQWCALSEERGIVISGGFSLVGTLANQMQMREWAIMTLPTGICARACVGVLSLPLF